MRCRAVTCGPRTLAHGREAGVAAAADDQGIGALGGPSPSRQQTTVSPHPKSTDRLTIIPFILTVHWIGFLSGCRLSELIPRWASDSSRGVSWVGANGTVPSPEGKHHREASSKVQRRFYSNTIIR